MSSVVDKIRIVVEKHFLHKGKRGMVCRVFAPSGNARSYTVVLEFNRIREQVFLDTGMVQHFDRTGNDQLIINAIRTAMHNIERMEKKYETRKTRT